MACRGVSTAREGSTARRPNRSAVVLLFGASAAAWKYLQVPGASFVSGLSTPGLRASAPKHVRRAFAFDLVESDDHVGLKVKKEDGIVTATTEGGLVTGNWNTILGDQELPASGRAYWEIKFLEKPSDSWEYVGVAEANADVTKPLTRNSKGKGFFVGGTRTESKLYQHIETQKSWKDRAVQHAKDDYEYRGGDAKNVDKDSALLHKGMWSAPGTHVGTELPKHVSIKQGSVVGVDADMDKGTLSFWTVGGAADGDRKFVGLARDLTGRPLNIKGKKLVPAMSIFGRDMGGETEFTKVEVRTGLEPPALS